MALAISTHWNACRHRDGEALIEEILSLGVRRVELGYDLRMDLVPGVRAMVNQKAVVVDSVHAFCPVPAVAPRGHPELFLLASPDRRERESAVAHLTATAEFAAMVGASVVVVHAGRADMGDMTRKLIELWEMGRRAERAFEKVKIQLLMKRERYGPPAVSRLSASIERLLPSLEQSRIRVAFENLPTWEAVPSESELVALLGRFNSPLLAYWHDVGHAQVRENLGFIGAGRWLDRLAPWLAGMHLHDVMPPATDHLMPPRGRVDFAALQPYAQAGCLTVMEPAPETPKEDVAEGLRTIEAAWGLAPVETSP